VSVVVQDNFLDNNYFQELKDIVFSEQFPWYMAGVLEAYTPGSTLTKGDPRNDVQMVHVAYADHHILSDFYQRLGPMFRDMGLYACHKVKINLLKREEKIIEHGLHIDITEAPENNLTSILYMNTNNGYTKFANGEKIESVENRFVTFPSTLKHTGSTNTCDAQVRCVMNINWQRLPENLIMEK
tara:strand:- start:32 stop:583 length:552 start_codon:yes stop_codon:yes gene_type:complete